MSVHVLLNLSNELGKRDKMQGLLSIFLFFLQEQSDMGPHCSSMRLQIFLWMTKKTNAL